MLSLFSAPGSWYLCKKLVYTFGGFCGCHPRDTALHYMVLVTSGTCIHGSHRTVANKERVLNWLMPPPIRT